MVMVLPGGVALLANQRAFSGPSVSASAALTLALAHAVVAECVSIQIKADVFAQAALEPPRIGQLRHRHLLHKPIRKQHNEQDNPQVN